MNVIDHPARAEASRRGELAERMVAAACELACLVRDCDGDREAVGAFINALTDEERDALLVVQAAMIPDDATARTLLSWVTWDEYGRPLPGVADRTPAGMRVLEPPPRARRWREEKLQACGSHAAYNRHKRRGELVDDDCYAGEAAYHDARKQARKQKAEAAGSPAEAEAVPLAPVIRIAEAA